jgi:hypothetical protein
MEGKNSTRKLIVHAMISILASLLAGYATGTGVKLEKKYPIVKGK